MTKAAALFDQPRRYALDLPPSVAILAPVNGNPRHAEQPRGVVSEKGVVRLRQSDSGLVQSAGVEGALAPIYALHLVRHHDVRMELRVGGSGFVVVERGGDHAHDRHLHDTARTDTGCSGALPATRSCRASQRDAPAQSGLACPHRLHPRSR